MKKQKRPPQPQARSAWKKYALSAAIGAGVGALITALVLTHPREAEKMATPAPATSTAQPPSTEGLPPARAHLVRGNWNYDRQNWPHAIEHYEQAIALGLDNPDVRTDLGNCYRFINQPRRALELYGIAQKQNPQHEQSLFNTVTLYAQSLNDHAAAAEAARAFIARFPASRNIDNVRTLLAQAEQGATQPPPNSGSLKSSERGEMRQWLEDRAAQPTPSP